MRTSAAAVVCQLGKLLQTWKWRKEAGEEEEKKEKQEEEEEKLSFFKCMHREPGH